MADIDYWLGRKYALMAQQADAQTTQANSGAIAATAAANLDNTKAKVLPNESAAQIALQRAQTFLTNEQGKVVAPEAGARIRNLDAETDFTGARTVGQIYENRMFKRKELDVLPGIMGNYPMFRLGS